MRKTTKLLAGATALFLSTSALADNHDIAALQTKALQDDVAYDIVEGLTTEIGPRQAGTEAEARARNWAVAKLNALGFSNVRNEPYMMPTWVRGTETASVISPYPQKLAITALGNSGSTGAQGLTAEVVYFPTLADLVAAPDGSLDGKIAFVSHEMKPTQDGSSYGAFGPARFVGPNIAAKKGAAAIVIRSAGTDHHRNPHTGNTNFEEGVTPIPAGALSIPDAENLVRMVERGKPVKLKLVLTPQNIGEQESGNVIAELPGSDPSLGMIVIGCHLDSWDLGTGAIDDGAGCAIITAAAKQVMAAGQPQRTIRLLWAGAEEVGLWGGNAYGEARKGDKHALAMESDFGADRVWRVEFNLPESAKPLADRIANALQPLGIGRGQQPATGGADVQAIIRNNNLAVIDLQQDGTRYFDLHHTPDDTLDKIDPEQLRQNVAAWTTVLSIVGNSDADLTMPPKE
ncbi:M20/M25/M40 family metallo-hydrolase [Parasphingorhabdus sp.]|uniref:M20/M25/M40 family metallo-hydrolase n=1 Tax=Parasphingorhabdus sp. TaxID=2709688 RepID=UPI003A8D95EF